MQLKKKMVFSSLVIELKTSFYYFNYKFLFKFTKLPKFVQNITINTRPTERSSQRPNISAINFCCISTRGQPPNRSVSNFNENTTEVTRRTELISRMKHVN